MFDYANMRSWLYHVFHIAPLNDFGSYALCMSDMLFDTAHSSTASPSFSVEVYTLYIDDGTLQKKLHKQHKKMTS